MHDQSYEHKNKETYKEKSHFSLFIYDLLLFFIIGQSFEMFIIKVTFHHTVQIQESSEIITYLVLLKAFR